MIEKLVIIFFFSLSLLPGAASPPIARVSDGRVTAIGETTTVNITLNEAPNGLSGYNLSVSLSNASIAEIISVEFPEWATLHSNSPLPADSIWVKSADLNDEVKSGNKNVTLVSLTIRGNDYGDARVLARVTKIDDDDGYLIVPTTTNGTFSISAPPTPTPTSTSTPTPIPTPAPTPGPTPTPTPGPIPGFELLFAVVALPVAYLLRNFGLFR